jgi:hypothetical protein
MPRKSKAKETSVEIVPLGRTEMAEQKLKSMIAQMVEDGVRQAMSGAGADLQPFFGSHAIACEIKRMQTVHEQNKFTYYFEDWGCMVCGSHKVGHSSCGMCASCYTRVKYRIRAGVQKRQPPQDSIQPTFMDTVRLAREALAPSITVLSPRDTKGRKRKA